MKKALNLSRVLPDIIIINDLLNVNVLNLIIDVDFYIVSVVLESLSISVVEFTNLSKNKKI